MNDVPGIEGTAPMPVAPAAIVYTPHGQFWIANPYENVKEWVDDDDTSPYDHISLVGLESTQKDPSIFRTYDMSLMRAYVLGLRSYSQEAFEEQFGPKPEPQVPPGMPPGLAVILGGGLAAMHMGEPVAAKDLQPETECCCSHPGEQHRMPEKMDEPVGECLDPECGCAYFHHKHGGK